MSPKKLLIRGAGIICFFYCLHAFLHYYSFEEPISYFRLTNLDKQLKENIYGQHIAIENIIQSLKTHFMMSTKALALVFYGEKGTGKSRLVNILKDNLFHPENVHIFTPEDMRNTNLSELFGKLETVLETTPESLFIFDHVEKMSPILLNGLLSYLDYTYFGDESLKKPVYIFISTKNTQSDIVMKKLLNDFFKSGNSRTTARLDDFEENLKKLLYNDRNGGFYASKLIKNNLIDHYIPFLPLEKEHIKNCIRDSFTSKGINANEDHINEVLSYMEWVPDKEQAYAVGGCKGVNQKVILVKNKYNLLKD